MRKLLYFLAVIHFFLFFYFISISNNPDCNMGIMLTFLLFYSIFFFLLYRQTIDFFEPIILYSCFNFLTPIVQLYILFHSDTNIFLNAQPLMNEFSTLYNVTCLMNLLGYYSCIIGYSLVKRVGKGKKVIVYPSQNLLCPFLIILVIFAFLNFVINMTCLGVNVFKNPVSLYQNVSLVKEKSSTIFYNCAIFGLYIYMAEKEKRNKIIELLLVLFTFILIISTLRIFSSLVILLTYIGTKYEESNNTKKNRKLFMIIVSLLVFGIILYFTRIIMSLELIGGNISLKSLIKNIGYYAFDKGNTPNIAIQMILYDRWDNFLLGKTFVSPFISLLGIDTTEFIPAAIIKQNYFMHITSGNLPVTGIGELYMNWGYFGVILGMFLFGGLGAIVYKKFYKSPNKIFRIMGMYFTISFYMLFPKGEINNIGLFQPICIIIIYTMFDFIHLSGKMNPIGISKRD